MNKQIPKTLSNDIFSSSEPQKLSEHAFRCRMAFLMLSIIACTVVMATSTFALFYTDVSSKNSTLASAYYSVSVVCADNASAEQYTCPLSHNDMHTFTIRADGTASAGYCQIQVGDKIYVTEKITAATAFTLTVQAQVGTRIAFTPHWGSPDASCVLLRSGDTLSYSRTQHAPYTVAQGDTIADIASRYGVSAKEILIYNGLTQLFADTDASPAPQLLPGMVLMIPGIEPGTLPDGTSAAEQSTIEDAADE